MTTRAEIETSVKTSTANLKSLDVSQVQSSSTLVSLDVDALDKAELIMQWESDYNINITPTESDNISTVQNAVDVICTKVGAV